MGTVAAQNERITPLRAFLDASADQQKATLARPRGLSEARKLLRQAFDADADDALETIRDSLASLPPSFRRGALLQRYGGDAVGARAWLQGKYVIASHHPGVGFGLARDKRIRTRKYLGAFASAQAALPWAERLHGHGRLSPMKFLSVLPTPVGIVLDWVHRGMLPPETLLSRYPHLREEQLQRLAEAGLLSKERWLAYGNMPHDLIAAEVATGRWAPLLCVGSGQVPDALVQTWVEQGYMTWRMFTVHHRKIWTPSAPLPMGMVRFATSQPDVVSLTDALGTMLHVWRSAELSADVSNKLARELIAARRLGMAAYTEAYHGTASVEACTVCFEPFAPEALCKSTACKHPPDMCQDCRRSAIVASAHGHCTSYGCDVNMTPNDLRNLGFGDKDVWRLIDSLSQLEVTERPTWTPCRIYDCIGGSEVGVGEHAAVVCNVCRTSQVVDNFEMDPIKNAVRIRQLTDDLGGQASLFGVTRECYHCGNPTTHAGGCAQMTCCRCKKMWFFSSGKGPGFTQNRQSYVPHTGIMVRSGLYQGLAPGSSQVSPSQLMRTVQTNIMRLRLDETEAFFNFPFEF